MNNIETTKNVASAFIFRVKKKTPRLHTDLRLSHVARKKLQTDFHHTKIFPGFLGEDSLRRKVYKSYRRVDNQKITLSIVNIFQNDVAQRGERNLLQIHVLRD